MITKQKKLELYTQHKDIIDMIWQLFGGMVAQTDIYNIMKALNHSTLEADIMFSIKELKDYSMLKDKQLFNSHNKMVYLSHSCLSVMGFTTDTLPYVSVTESRQIETLYKTKIYLTAIIPGAKDHFNLQKQDALSLEQVVNYIKHCNSSLLISKARAIDYYNLLNETSSQYLSNEFQEDRRLLDINYRQHLITFSNKSNVVLSQEELDYKERIDSLKADMSRLQSLRTFYTFANLIQSNFIIRQAIFTPTKIKVGLYYMQSSTSNRSVERIAENLANLLLMIQKYSGQNQQITLFCKILCYSSDSHSFYIKESNKRVYDIYQVNFKPYNKIQNAIIKAGVSEIDLPNIEISPENYDIESTYHITI